jgi:YegS/Rv2252/BmrU family lipid kinase
MAGRRFHLIFNPGSRSGKAEGCFKPIISLLKKKNIIFSTSLTSCLSDAYNLSQKAVADGFDVVVSVGGDGTICEVVNGMLSSENPRGAQLGVIHVGSSPDFNRCYGIPMDIEQAIEALVLGKTKIIDIGKMEYTDLSGRRTVSFFGSNANVGLGPLIAGKANSRHRKYLGDFAGTLCATIGSALSFKGIDLSLTIDGYRVNYPGILNLTVGKDPYLASGMRIKCDISSDDARFYLLAVKKMPFMSFVRHLPKLYSGDFLSVSGVEFRYAREVVVESNKDALVEFDGDVRGYLPAKMSVMPEALKVIVQ